jgi:hypothetical protein
VSEYPAAECFRWRREIPEGEPFWSLDRMHQIMRGGVIEVLEAVQVECLCRDCTDDRPSIYGFLRGAPGLPPKDVL